MPLSLILPADSEMATRIREYDWAASPIGAPSQWPPALIIALNLCLRSSVPTSIYWGHDLRLIYNDAWSFIPGDRHPWAMGRAAAEVWTDIWDVVAPQMRKVMETGEGFSTFDQPLMIDRGNGPVETFWNYSFTPIVAQDGQVVGIFNQGNEVTDKVLEERRQQFLLRFSDALRPIFDPADIIRTAQRLLGEELGANRVGYGDVDPTERYFTTTDNWTDGVPSRHGTHDLAGFGPDIHGALKRGEPLVIEDVRRDPRTSSPEFVAAFEAIDTRAAITASLVKGGRMVVALYVHAREPRVWGEADRRLVQDVAERTWTELARATAERHAKLSEERYRRIFQQASDLIITADLQQVVTDCNDSAAAAVGLTREEAIGRNIADFLSSEDFERTSGMLRQKLGRGGTTRYDVRVRSRSGDLLYWEVNSGLTYDEGGHPIGLHVVGRDVTDRKRWEHHQRLLVAELNHRVKNSLTVVQSLAHQTFKANKPPLEAFKAFEGRLGTLAAAHNLLTRENWDNASLHDVVQHALAAFCANGRCNIEGPAIRIIPAVAVSLSLALHELATNAIKYGAFSNEDGRVDIAWTVGDDLVIEWRERDGPPVEGPRDAGFGTRMLQRALAADIRGNVDLDFAASGLRCRIRTDLANVVGQSNDELGDSEDLPEPLAGQSAN